MNFCFSFFLRNVYFVLCIRVFCLYVYNTCVSITLRGQKKNSDPLELGLRMVMSNHVGAGFFTGATSVL